jgi:membrane protease YdiL (CAAX protease family)
MNTKTYPSFGQAFVLILFLLVAGLAGFPGYIPYLIWKTEFTHNIGYISIYVAAFVLTIHKAVNTIRRSGDQFSISTLFKKDIDWIQAVILIFLTLTIGCCTGYLTRLFELTNLFEADITRTMKYPTIAFVEVVILPAFLEEILIRGIFMERFLQRYSAWVAVLMSAFLFGVMHGNPSQIFEGFIIGCFLGFVYVRTRNIKYCILIHFVNNGFAWLGYQLSSNFTDSPVTKYLNGIDTNQAGFYVSMVLSIAGLFLLNKRYENTAP